MFSSEALKLNLVQLIDKASREFGKEQLLEFAQDIDRAFDTLYQDDNFKNLVIQSDEDLKVSMGSGCDFSKFILAYRSFYERNV
ncbi:hypothetical protein AB6C40_14860 [Vibrio splendidus]